MSNVLSRHWKTASVKEWPGYSRLNRSFCGSGVVFSWTRLYCAAARGIFFRSSSPPEIASSSSFPVGLLTKTTLVPFFVVQGRVCPINPPEVAECQIALALLTAKLTIFTAVPQNQFSLKALPRKRFLVLEPPAESRFSSGYKSGPNASPSPCCETQCRKQHPC